MKDAMPYMYLSLFVEQAGPPHSRNEQITKAQPTAEPTKGYPSVG